MTTEETTDQHADEIEGVIHQPTLPTMELPDYHGRKPVGMKTSLAGAGTRVTRPHTIGDRIVLVIEARVKSASHEDTDDGLVYSEKLKVLDLFELEGAQGSRLISTIRSLYRTGEDAIKGRRPIPDLGDTGYTDASGVVLTAAEVADLRGDPIRTLLEPELTPAVVVYDDGARDLWPDDYPRHDPRPKVGDRYLTENGEALVVELLHHETGETIALLDGIPTEAEISDQAAREKAAAGKRSGNTADAADEVEQSRTEAPLEPVSRSPLAAVPDLPPEADDPYAGDLGDNADGWETPDRRTPAEAAAEHADDMETARIEATLPTADDFAFVDCQISELLGKLAAVTDVVTAARIELAERQGRGRSLKPRAGAMTAIGKRIAELSAQSAVAQ